MGRFDKIYEGLAGLTAKQQLEIIEAAWVTVAERARDAELGIPGGFERERARQVTVLLGLAKLIGSDTPDVEFERLMQEGDWRAVRHRLLSTIETFPIDDETRQLFERLLEVVDREEGFDQ